MSLNILIMGPAGSGKGTMSELIEKEYSLAHISSGDMFRSELSRNTPLGQKAKEYMNAGLLVPDDVTIGMVMNRIDQPDCENGYILDGFPRSLVQADVFDTKVIDTNKEISLVINLEVDQELLVQRIENRRLCRNCGASYNLISLPPKQEGICDVCGGELYQRADDNRESLVTRLRSYEEETAPVLRHYRSLGIVRDINSSQEIAAVWEDISKVLDEYLQKTSEKECE